MARTNKVSTQDDESNQLMSGEENVQNNEGAAAGEDVRNETGNEEQKTERSSPGGEDQGTEDDSLDCGNQEQSEHVFKILTATYPILYLSHQYRIGDVLPANDPEMVKAWLAAKTAAWTPAGAGKEGSEK